MTPTRAITYEQYDTAQEFARRCSNRRIFMVDEESHGFDSGLGPFIVSAAEGFARSCEIDEAPVVLWYDERPARSYSPDAELGKRRPLA
jgi:hypothetical protein